MKRIGILLVALLFSGFTAFAQSSSSASTSTSGTDATTTQQQQRNAAVSDENAAQQAKENGKNAGTKAAEEHDKALARLDDAGKILNQLITAPDNGIRGRT